MADHYDDAPTSRREYDILEHAVRTVAERAAHADRIIEEARAAGLDASHPIAVQAKMLRRELLQVKAELERLVPSCSVCGLDVHWVAGLGARAGHWAHREPAPHGEPAM
jgi:hypothetical protein